MPSAFLRKVKRRLQRYAQYALRLRRKLIHRPALFEDGYSIDDATEVTLYTEQDELFADYSPRIRPSQAVKARKVTAALIAVAKNEEDSVRTWFNAVMNQTRLPDEIVVVDTGSSDATVALLKEMAQSSQVSFQVIEAPGTNISQGRNLAIRAAQAEHIAVTDFGTTARPNWLENLLLPFEVNPQTEVSGGWYETVGEDGQPYRWRKWISLLGKNPQEILSPSVSIAFTRTAWQRVGGYPEWLTMTGEDTYLDLELKRTCRWWAFSPDALVDWQAPTSILAYWKKMYRWSSGDGETGLRASAYWYASLISALTLLGLLGALLCFLLAALLHQPWLAAAGGLLLAALVLRAANSGRKAGYSPAEVLLVIGILAAQALGFIRGASRRLTVTRRRIQQARGIFFLLAGIPIDDTGGGARSTQLALELLRRQMVVCYLNQYPKSESVELHLSIRHPNLFTYAVKDFDLDAFCARYQIDLDHTATGVITELPHSDLQPIIAALHRHGARMVYELIDEWDSKLGEGWYNPAVEQAISQKAVALTATAPMLQDRLQASTGRAVSLLPNAVNLRLFNRHKHYPPPPDLPHSEMIITYIGALYGSWFDWDLLVQIARQYTQASVMVIGDYRGQSPQELPNMHFLGLKAQSSLPAYLAHSTVAIIPWKVNDITLATSPLKLYEYLAMHLPVVVPNLPLLQDIPGVYPASQTADFLRWIQVAADTAIDPAAVDAFVSQNAWDNRINQLLSLLNFDELRSSRRA